MGKAGVGAAESRCDLAGSKKKGGHPNMDLSKNKKHCQIPVIELQSTPKRYILEMPVFEGIGIWVKYRYPCFGVRLIPPTGGWVLPNRLIQCWFIIPNYEAMQGDDNEHLEV